MSADQLLEVVGSDDSSAGCGGLRNVKKFHGLVDGFAADHWDCVSSAGVQHHHLLFDSFDLEQGSVKGSIYAEDLGDPRQDIDKG